MEAIRGYGSAGRVSVPVRTLAGSHSYKNIVSKTTPLHFYNLMHQAPPAATSPTYATESGSLLPPGSLP